MKRHEVKRKLDTIGEKKTQDEKMSGEILARTLYFISNSAFYDDPNAPYGSFHDQNGFGIPSGKGTFGYGNPLCSCPPDMIPYDTFIGKYTNPFEFDDNPPYPAWKLDEGRDLFKEIKEKNNKKYFTPNSSFKTEDFCICSKRNTYYNNTTKKCECIPGTVEKNGECSCPKENIYTYTYLIGEDGFIHPSENPRCECPNKIYSLEEVENQESGSLIESPNKDSCVCDSIEQYIGGMSSTYRTYNYSTHISNKFGDLPDCIDNDPEWNYIPYTFVRYGITLSGQYVYYQCCNEKDSPSASVSSSTSNI